MTEPFTRFEAVAVPLEDANVDTGRIFPSRFLRKPRTVGYQKFLFHDARFDEKGRERPDFIMNRPPYRDARILIAGSNFGCGSSRESAVHAFIDAGFRAIIAPKFGDIFYASCFRNGVLPVVLPFEDVQSLQRQLHDDPGSKICIDLCNQQVAGPDGRAFRFEVDAVRKTRLERGLDDVTLALEAVDQIRKFESRYRLAVPWTG
ncbi:MAG: 3-isopropylmalate dehydratase small subunit [Hyphomicrobiales bacterium]